MGAPVDPGGNVQSLAGEVKGSTGEADASSVQHAGREDMSFFDGDDLLAEAFVDAGQGVHAGGFCHAVVDRVHAGKRVTGGKDMVQTSSAEVFANSLQRVIEGFRDPAAEFGAVLHGPQREQVLDTGRSFGTGGVIGDQGDV